MHFLIHTPALRLGLALALLLGALAAPAAAQEDKQATLDWLDAVDQQGPCGGENIGETDCVHNVTVTLEYTTILPATITCTMPGLRWVGTASVATTYEKAVSPNEESGVVTLSLNSSPDQYTVDVGVDETGLLACKLEAEGVSLEVTKAQPHAETALEGEAAPEQAAPEGEQPEEDTGGEVSDLLVDSLLPGDGANFNEVQDYILRRGVDCTLGVLANLECGVPGPATNMISQLTDDFSVRIGIVDNAVPSDNDKLLIYYSQLAIALTTLSDPQGRPLFPALAVGHRRLRTLAEQAAADPSRTQAYFQYLSYLARIDIDRGSSLAAPGNN